MGVPVQRVAERSSSGLAPHVAGALCYFLGFVTGVLFLMTEKESHFVRFHAMQSTVVFLGLLALQLVINFLGGLGLIGSWIAVLSVGLWVYLMYKAYTRELFQVPLAGGIAARELDRPL